MKAEVDCSLLITLSDIECPGKLFALLHVFDVHVWMHVSLGLYKLKLIFVQDATCMQAVPSKLRCADVIHVPQACGIGT